MNVKNLLLLIFIAIFKTVQSKSGLVSAASSVASAASSSVASAASAASSAVAVASVGDDYDYEPPPPPRRIPKPKKKMPPPPKELSKYLDEHWGDFKNIFKKKYHPDEEEQRRHRFETFSWSNFHHNLQSDLGRARYTRGLNAYSDLTEDEFKKFRTGYIMDDGSQPWGTTRKKSGSVGDSRVPSYIDWRKSGAVNPPRDQGDCGSCWAITSLGTVEAQYKKKTGKLIELSIQNLIDCAPTDGGGCSGGWMTQAYQWIKKHGGINTEKNYPYEEKQNKCRFDNSAKATSVRDYAEVPEGDIDELKRAVGTVGPVAAAIDASPDSFQTYKNGIYDDQSCSSTNVNHAILIIGYGTEDGVDYWLIRNSWGTSWGMNGYMKIIRDKDNICGLATRASYALAL